MAEITMPVSTQEEIRSVILQTLRDLVCGCCKVSRANAIFNGIRLLQIEFENENDLPIEGPIPIDSEEADFRALLHELWSREPLREWRQPEIRGVAVELGLFQRWLTTENADSYSSMSRFGLLCDRQLKRKHGKLSLHRQGQGRHRTFTIHEG